MTQVAGEGLDAAARTEGRCPVIHLDVATPLTAGSYWQKADELRELGPAFFNSIGQGYWIFTRYEQVREIYQHPEIFSSESITPWEPEPAYRFVPTQIDPPEHSRYRQLLSRWFAPHAVNEITPAAHDLCRRLIAGIAPRGSCDFVSDFAMRFPTEVFLTLVGLPASDADLFVPWVEDFFRGFGGDQEQQAAMMAALSGIRGYWAGALDERRGEPVPRAGDLASHLLHSTVDGAPLSDDLILDMLVVLVLAGLDTTRGQLGYLFRHLADNPDDRHRLAAESELIPSAVEEALRLYTIVFGDGRPRRAPRPPGDAGGRRGMVGGHPRFPRGGRGTVARTRRRQHDGAVQPPARLGGGGRVKLTVDGNRCTGHGRCYTVATDLLSFDDEGYVAARGQMTDVPDNQIPYAREAADTCPEGAITLIEN